MRKLIYFLFFFVIAIAVFYKARVMEEKEKQEIISISREWEKHGKPVDVVNTVVGDAHCLEKISGIIEAGNIVRCEVAEDIASKLRPGQEFTALLRGKTVKGRVDAVSRQRDILTGLYGVKLKIKTSNSFSRKSIIVAKVRVNTLRNVLRIPQRALIRDNSHSYCWVIEDGLAQKRNVITGVDCEEDIQIVSGLKFGEAVCVNGMGELSDGDKTRIRSTPEAPQ
jgi:hypothetical protein